MVLVVYMLSCTVLLTTHSSGGSAMFGELRKVEQALGYTLMPQVDFCSIGSARTRFTCFLFGLSHCSTLKVSKIDG